MNTFVEIDYTNEMVSIVNNFINRRYRLEGIKCQVAPNHYCIYGKRDGNTYSLTLPKDRTDLIEISK